MSVMNRGEKALDLMDYMSDADKEAFGALVSDCEKEKDPALKMRKMLCQLHASEKFSSLSEVHPAWILEKLCGESPRVIGIILRYLPSKHVRFILKNLPPMLRAQIPDMVESFSVAAPVLAVIKERFERHFLPMRVSRGAKRLDFENIYYLTGEELGEVVLDMGLVVLGIALRGMPAKTLHVVFNRLDLKDARLLQLRIKDTKHISSDLFRYARQILLEVDEEHIGPRKMLSRIGLAALALALGESPDALVRLVQQRLSPDDGYLLKRLIDEKRFYYLKSVSAELRDTILGSIAGLSRNGRIDSLSPSFEGEATATATQLA